VIAKAAVAVRRELEQSEGFDSAEYESYISEVSARVAATFRNL
jgi:hypothetical protein